MTVPIDIAVHYIGCSTPTANGVRVPSRAGPFLECLAECVRHVTVVAYEPPPAPTFEDGVEYEIRAPNISLVSLGPKGTWRDYRVRRRRIARIIEEASPSWDILMFYFLPNRRARLVYGPNRCPRIVGFVVGTTATGALPRSTSTLRRVAIVLNRYWTAFQQRAVLRRAGLVVVNSEELRRSVPRQTSNVRTVTLAARRRRHVFRADDRFQGPVINAMVAGRITLEKGVIDAVEAFALLTRHVGPIKLHVAGEGPALDAMLERAVQLGVRDDVVVHGWIPAGDELFSLLKTMDVFLMPSYADYEGFPQVIWEAMAHSVPVVTTAVRGPREVLTDELDVLFVPMNDATAIADAVRKLAGDQELRRRLLERGYQLASAVNIDETVGSILEAIEATWSAFASSDVNR